MAFGPERRPLLLNPVVPEMVAIASGPRCERVEDNGGPRRVKRGGEVTCSRRAESNARSNGWSE